MLWVVPCSIEKFRVPNTDSRFTSCPLPHMTLPISNVTLRYVGSRVFVSELYTGWLQIERFLGRPLGYLIFSLMALIGAPIYAYLSKVLLEANPDCLG